jgi:hypothetical protein
MTAFIPPGNDANDPLTFLRDELARVSPSPEFAAGVRERVASEDQLDALRAELIDLSPSPGFAMGVRQRIEEDRERRSAWWPMSGWRWMVPIGGASAVLLIAMTLSGTDVPAPAIQRATAPPRAQQPPARPAEPDAPSRTTMTRTATSSTRHPPIGGASDARDAFPEVISNQAEVIRALWAQATIPVVTESTASIPVEPGEIVVPALEVKPIVVKLLFEPPPSEGGFPIIRRVAAAEAVRSEK